MNISWGKSAVSLSHLYSCQQRTVAYGTIITHQPALFSIQPVHTGLYPIGTRHGILGQSQRVPLHKHIADLPAFNRNTQTIAYCDHVPIRPQHVSHDGKQPLRHAIHTPHGLQMRRLAGLSLA